MLIVGIAGRAVVGVGLRRRVHARVERQYEVDEGRPIWKLRPLQMLVTLAMILLLAIAAIARRRQRPGGRGGRLARSALGDTFVDGLEHRQVAGAARRLHARAGGPLLRVAERQAARLQVHHARRPRRRRRVDRRVARVRVLRRELRLVRQDLRLARRRRSSSSSGCGSRTSRSCSARELNAERERDKQSRRASRTPSASCASTERDEPVSRSSAPRTRADSSVPRTGRAVTCTDMRDRRKTTAAVLAGGVALASAGFAIGSQIGRRVRRCQGPRQPRPRAGPCTSRPAAGPSASSGARALERASPRPTLRRRSTSCADRRLRGASSRCAGEVADAVSKVSRARCSTAARRTADLRSDHDDAAPGQGDARRSCARRARLATAARLRPEARAARRRWRSSVSRRPSSRRAPVRPRGPLPRAVRPAARVARDGPGGSARSPTTSPKKLASLPRPSRRRSRTSTPPSATSSPQQLADKLGIDVAKVKAALPAAPIADGANRLGPGDRVSPTGVPGARARSSILVP